jgi:outer membrane protein OmpA-like peptidoglycan-associated protein
LFHKNANGELYDPNVNKMLEEVGRLAGQFGMARIVIEGYTDSSMKDFVPLSAVKTLSLDRANSVKQELVRKFKLQPNQLAVEGMGWNKEIEPCNHAMNRRVEIKVYPLEQQ